MGTHYFEVGVSNKRGNILGDVIMVLFGILLTIGSFQVVRISELSMYVAKKLFNLKPEDSNGHSKLSDMDKVVLNLREVGYFHPAFPCCSRGGQNGVSPGQSSGFMSL